MPEVSEKDRLLTPEGSANVKRLLSRRDWCAMDGEDPVIVTSEVMGGGVVVLNSTNEKTGTQVCISATTDSIRLVLGSENDPTKYQAARDFLARLKLSGD